MRYEHPLKDLARWLLRRELLVMRNNFDRVRAQNEQLRATIDRLREVVNGRS